MKLVRRCLPLLEIYFVLLLAPCACIRLRCLLVLMHVGKYWDGPFPSWGSAHCPKVLEALKHVGEYCCLLPRASYDTYCNGWTWR